MRRGMSALCAAAGMLALAAPAQGAITGSSVTTPKDPRFFVNDDDAGGTAIAVKGKTSGGNPAVDKVDLRCYYGTAHPTISTNISLAANGSFSVPAASLVPIESTLCRLRAVPAGVVPADPAPFRGPVIGVGYRSTRKISGGPNDGLVSDFYIYAQQRQAAFDYDSLSGCGLDDGYLNDSTLDSTTTTFYCNDWFWWYENYANQGASTRSQLMVDGSNAYAARAAEDINELGNPGFPPVTYSFKVNPASGNTTIHSSELLVKCPNATYPPTAVTCPSFTSTGVRDVRTIVQDHSGHLTMITDAFKSVDRKPHRLDLLSQNDQRFYGSGATFDATTVAYRFPGQGAFATHAIGDTVTLPKKAPASIFVKQRDAADGQTDAGRGAITYANRSLSATFNDVDTSASDFYLHQRARIPRGGAAMFYFAYSHAFGQKQVARLARLAERRLRPCRVPALGGKKLRAARRALRRANCRRGKVRRRSSQSVPAGRVIRSKPPVGTKLPPSSRVKLIVSKG